MLPFSQRLNSALQFSCNVAGKSANPQPGHRDHTQPVLQRERYPDDNAAGLWRESYKTPPLPTLSESPIIDAIAQKSLFALPATRNRSSNLNRFRSTDGTKG